eukprot:12404.XXX_364978_364471_1 [CDS] Oithona nana genome sequencing.
MGNSNAKVVNDTEEPIHLYVFDYADGLRWWPREEFALKPHHTHDVKALAHMSGMIIATSTGKRGHHLEVANGATLNVSDLLKAPHNRWYKSCHAFLCGGILLTFVLVCTATGGAITAAVAGPTVACNLVSSGVISTYTGGVLSTAG